MHVSLYQHHVHVLIQVKNNDRRGVDRFGRDGVGLTDLAMSMSSMWPRRVAGLQTVTSPLRVIPEVHHLNFRGGTLGLISRYRLGWGKNMHTLPARPLALSRGGGLGGGRGQ